MTLTEPRPSTGEPTGGTLPPGLWEYAEALGARVEARLGAVVGDVADWVDAPARLGGLGVRAEPVPWGEGALCVDLGPDDEDTWQRLCGSLASGAEHGDVAGPTDAEPVDAEAAAAEAQQWRLAVTPYRQLSAPVAGRAPSEPAALLDDTSRPLGAPRRSLADVTVVDLSSMWAGPLCTQLLARAGARVIKVESNVRVDGLRGSPAHFRQLNEDKEVVELDLRQLDERRALDDCLAAADLLVTSMSRRALANLGLLPSQLRRPMRTLAITAYEPNAPEADWIAYGSGVHATSGLGWLGAQPEPCEFSYPDPLAGLVAAATAADQLTSARPTACGVSLADAVAPLVHAALASARRR